MYAVSFGILGAQFLASAFDITIVNFEGTEIQNPLEQFVDVDVLNIRTSDVVNTNSTLITTDPVLAAASIAQVIFLLMTGMYVFNIMILMGVPVIFVSGFVLLYLIMLARAVIGYIRGI